jgi:hypothetical protein
MATYEVSRTLIKSPPELWTELEGERLSEALGEVEVRTTERERAIAWEGDGARGTATLEPAGWGTKVTLTAEVEQRVAQLGFWGRFRPPEPQPTPWDDVEKRFESLLDHLGSAHHKPFTQR